MTPPDANGGPWTPGGVVTLTTDFGLVDPYVGILHGVLLRDAPSLRAVVDVTHAVPAQDVRTAAFQLRQAAPWFPAGTVHLAVVDPGVGSSRRVLVALDRGCAFVAPDNGLLGPVVAADAPVWAVEVERIVDEVPSRTFHGRDVFAPLAARLAAGLHPADAGPPAGEWERLAFPTPDADGSGCVAGEVLLADRFGNLVTNLPAALVAEDGPWSVEVDGARIGLRGTYAEAPPGDLLALVDSYGLVEIAVRDGDASRRLGLASGARVRLVRES